MLTKGMTKSNLGVNPKFAPTPPLPLLKYPGFFTLVKQKKEIKNIAFH